MFGHRFIWMPKYHFLNDIEENYTPVKGEFPKFYLESYFSVSKEALDHGIWTGSLKFDSFSNSSKSQQLQSFPRSKLISMTVNRWQAGIFFSFRASYKVSTVKNLRNETPVCMLWNNSGDYSCLCLAENTSTFFVDKLKQTFIKYYKRK